MRKLFMTLVALLSLQMASAQKSDNVVYQDAQARFTLITDGVVRMEWSPTGQFEDHRSFIHTERNYAPVKAKVSTGGSMLTIETSQMVLKYKKNSGKFTAKNLSVTSQKKARVPFKWTPGTADKGNLGGTYRTLDGCDGDQHYYWADNKNQQEDIPLEKGLLSTEGWTLLDDSQSLLFDESDFPWVEERKKGECQDWYFMAYGHDYKKALGDYTKFAGKVPLPPRYAFGFWWSRYWSYSDAELRDLVKKFEDYDLPLDVLVVDMDWHWVEDGKGGWTGYTWNRRLFPEPNKFLGWLKSKDLSITLNLHPADGVKTYEEKYPEMAKWMGMNPEEKKDIDFVVSDKKMMNGWFHTILNPMHKAGVDFWWLDWQQWPNDPVIKSLSNTWWLNYLFFTKAERDNTERPLLYHRWGGLGNHRYQIGFSGDTFSTWASLEYQPYFNSTASNVLYGFWSHDLGGHMLNQDKFNYELSVRWHQFGVYSAVMRSHSTKDARLRKEPWAYPQEMQEAFRQTIIRRYEIAPYIYTMARKTYDTGISLCRPMYYDYPEAKEAYDMRNEYMYGDQMLVMPISTPMVDGYSKVNVWLPAGNDWYELSSGTMLKGGQTIERAFQIDEFPVYVKAGSVIPAYGKVKNLRSNNEAIYLEVYPGADGEFTLYEDNGNDQEYASHFATTLITNRRVGGEQTITINPRKGNYEGMPAKRTYRVKAMGVAQPDMIFVDGKVTMYTFDPEAFTYMVELAQMDPTVEHTIKFVWNTEKPDVNGLVGNARRMQKTLVDMKYRDAGINLVEGLGEMGSLGVGVMYNPSEYNQRVQQFQESMQNLPALLDKQGMSPENKAWFLKSMGM